MVYFLENYPGGGGGGPTCCRGGGVPGRGSNC